MTTPEIQGCLTNLRVGALEVDGLQINMETDDKGVSSLRAALQLMGCDGQCGGTAHGLQQTEASLLAQQSVHTELTQAHSPRESITWGGRGGEGLRQKPRERVRESSCEGKVPLGQTAVSELCTHAE